MKKIFLFVWFSISIHYSFAQITFSKVYGGSDYDYAYSVTQTFDKGYMVAGVTTSFGSGATDAYILKVDSLGKAKWHRMYGGINIDRFYSIRETKDSCYVIAGYTNSFGAGGYDGYLVKIDSIGNIIWSKTYGGTNWDFIYSVDTTSDGGYILCGGTYSKGAGDQDMYLIKTNAIGDTLWTKTFGGTKEDVAKALVGTNDGGYLLTGMTKSFGEPNGDIYTIKTNAVGDTVWTRKQGGPLEDYANDIVETGNGFVHIAGSTKNGIFGNLDGVIVQYAISDGFFVTADYYGGANEDGFNSVTCYPWGRYRMVGYTYSFGFGLTGTPDVMWYQQIPFDGGNTGNSKTDIAYCVRNTKDGGYIICGQSDSYTTLDHIFLMKTDSLNFEPATVSVVVTSIDETNFQPEFFKVYPNPVSNVLSVNYTNEFETDALLTIEDITGKLHYSEIIKKSSKQSEHNISHLANGIYLLSVKGDKFISTQKIIVQH